LLAIVISCMLSLYLNQSTHMIQKEKEKKKVAVVRPRFCSPLSPPLPFSRPRHCMHAFLSHTFLLYCLGFASPMTSSNMASHLHLEDNPMRNTTPVPPSPLPTTGNLDQLISLFHETAANLGLPAEGFPPITPANISTLSIGEQIVLPLCSSLQTSVHITTILDPLSTEVNNLAW